jgi:DNA-directed RNA polymerase subunit M/transcription elongation factor TFIIS
MFAESDNFFTLAFCHIYESEEIKAMTIHTIPKHTCPSCGGEGEYLGALLDMSGQEEREYLFWKCLDCRQEWQTKKKESVGHDR